MAGCDDRKHPDGGQGFFSPAGQYRVRVSQEGCADSVVFSVSADDTAYPAGRIELSAHEISYGGLLGLRAAVTGASRYHWNLGNGRTVETIQQQIQEYYYVSGDSIPIELTAISERNCISKFQTTVKVGNRKSSVLPDQSFIGRLKDWNVFPNPFTHQLKVSVVMVRGGQIRLDLWSASGQWIRSWNRTVRQGENLLVLDGVEHLPGKRTYIISSNYNGILHSDKIFKQ